MFSVPFGCVTLTVTLQHYSGGECVRIRMDADQMCSVLQLQMFNQFKLHIKMNLIALFVSWSYLKRRFNVSSKVSSEID